MPDIQQPDTTPESAPEAFVFPEVDIQKHREFHLEYDRPYTEKEARSKELALFYISQFFNHAEAEGLFPHKPESREFSSEGVGDMAAIYQRNVADVDDPLEYSSKITREVKKNAHDAFHDGLTGLLNRKGFDKELSSRMAAIEREDDDPSLDRKAPRPAALFVIDLNGMKKINDEKGHPVGDMILVSAAEVIMKTVRGQDIVARTGGDEFMVAVFKEEEPDEGPVPHPTEGVIDGKRGVEEEIDPGMELEQPDLIRDFSKRVALETLARIEKAALGDVDDLELAIGGVEWDVSKPFQEMYEEADAKMYRDKEEKYAAKGEVPRKEKPPK
ncbi:GGDEF domain-containing protein [Candidatus Saccharibacteria bacterium]|nr:GGDEF domain-containing protein [Candidatus Saccharibacteria bacterium]